MLIGLIEFLLIAGLVLAVAVFELLPLQREKWQADRERKRRDAPPDA